MAGELIAGLGAFKTMFDIAKRLKDANDANIRNSAVIELQEQILGAQEQQSKLIKRTNDLEQEVNRLKAWDTEKQRYKLTEVSPGVVAYTPKESERGSEPFHMLCANCFQRGEKSYLQASQELRARRRVYKCHHCKAEVELEYVPRAEPTQTRANTRYNPFNHR